MILKDDFYELVNSNREHENYTTVLKVRKDHKIFNGHFPGRPVTPGVVLMQLFKEEVERHFQKKLRMVRADNVKFISVFDPGEGEDLTLESEIQENGAFLKLKGIAKNEKGIVLKISALYKEA